MVCGGDGDGGDGGTVFCLLWWERGGVLVSLWVMWDSTYMEVGGWRVKGGGCLRRVVILDFSINGDGALCILDTGDGSFCVYLGLS